MKLKHKSYSEVIAEQDEYVSPEAKTRTPFSASFKFYSNLVRIILFSNLKTKLRIYERYNWANSSLDILHNLEKSSVRFFIKGMNNLYKFKGPAVFISNHMSTLETVVLPGIIQPVKPVCFVTKHSLNTYPIFGPINKARHPIVVGRANPREDLQIVFDEGAKRLADGRSILIFPQKTRQDLFIEKQFNTLGIKLAKKNDVYVVPIALLTDAWANGVRIKEFGEIDPSKTVHIEFGEPFKVESNGSIEHEKVLNFIKSKLNQWGREDLIIEE